MDSATIYNAVTERYTAFSSDAAILEGAYGKAVAQSFGYTENDLDGVPESSNLGLSCGNPIAMASLREGETVIDLGCGAGLDVFMAAKKVGPTGRVIGVDMNEGMLSLAEKNKAAAKATNAEFVLGRITAVPLGDGLADVIISNCVINLVPEGEKQFVFNEMFRLLKPGGRVAVADTLAKKPLSSQLRASVAAYVGCISGASLVDEYEKYFKQSGFTGAVIQDAHADLNIYMNTRTDGSKKNSNDTNTVDSSGCCAPAPASDCQLTTNAKVARNDACCVPPAAKPHASLEIASAELQSLDLNEWVGSYKIFALKE